MKYTLIYAAVLAFSILAIPALAAFNINTSQNNIENTLVSYQNRNLNRTHKTEAFESLTLSENSFTQFRVLDYRTNTVFEISARDYVIGAVCAEMPASFETEALKAQAVAVYTYAVRRTLDEIENPTPELCGANISNNPDVHLAFYDNAQIRELFGENYDEYYKKVSDAVDAVFGQVLIYNGEPIVAAFHSMSSGRTESAENIWGTKTDYLVAVESAGDINCNDYAAQTVFSVEQMRAVLEQNVEGVCLENDPAEWIRITSTSQSDTVLSVKVGNITLQGVTLRSILNLRSNAFDVEYSQSQGFVFTNYGYGHGVGMSQFGANEMAKNSKKYHEILFHYYTGAKIAEIEFVF